LSNTHHFLTSKINPVFFSGFLLLVVILLLPFCTNGIWFDDAINSQMFDYLQMEKLGLLEVTYMIFKGWLNAGRLMFGFFIGYPLFYLFHDPIALRVAHIICTILNLVVWAIMLSSYGMSKRQIYLWALFVVALFQVEPAGDPVGGFSFHYQTLGILLGASLWLLSKYLKTVKKIYLLSALGVWFFSMMLYEINIIFIPLAICLIYVANKNNLNREFYRDITLILFAFSIYLTIYLVIKFLAITPAYNGSTLSISIATLGAFIKQVFNTLPLTHWLFSYYNTNSFSDILSNYLTFINAFIFLLGIFILFSLKSREASKVNYSLYIIFTCMLFLPALIASISLRYQNEITWGWPALTIYYQIFGISYFFVLIFDYICKYKPLFFINIILISVYMSFNYSVNYSTAAIMDVSYRAPRDGFIRFVNSNLSELNNGDAVLFSSSVPIFITTNFIYSQTKKYIYEIPSPGRVQPLKVPPANARKYQIFRDGSDQYRIEPLN
jgi:hypothetical protein